MCGNTPGQTRQNYLSSPVISIPSCPLSFAFLSVSHLFLSLPLLCSSLLSCLLLAVGRLPHCLSYTLFPCVNMFSSMKEPFIPFPCLVTFKSTHCAITPLYTCCKCLGAPMIPESTFCDSIRSDWTLARHWQ